MLEVLRGLDRSRFCPFLYTREGGDLLGQALGLGIPVVVADELLLTPPTVASDGPGPTAGSDSLAERLRRDCIDVALVYAWPAGMMAARDARLRAIVERVDGPTSVRRIRDKSAAARIICESRAVRELLVSSAHAHSVRSPADPRRSQCRAHGPVRSGAVRSSPMSG